MNGWFVNKLFNEEPTGTFATGYVFTCQPDLSSARPDPANGYWHCNLANQNKLNWSERVYELFGRPAGVPILREWAVGRYTKPSKAALESVRKYALSRHFGFILDAKIRPEGALTRSIRVLAIPILENNRVVALHGVKRAL